MVETFPHIHRKYNAKLGDINMTMSFDALKKNRSNSLSKLNSQLEKITTKSYSDPNEGKMWKPTRDKAGNGFAIVRFLPATQGEEMPFVRLWDHGLQCYALKREYAKKIIDYYFENGRIHYKMPLGAPPSFENNVMHGFGKVYSFPLFNQNVSDFRSKNIYYYNQQADSAIYSYEFLKDWWEKKGSQKSLDDIMGEANYE